MAGTAGRGGGGIGKARSAGVVALLLVPAITFSADPATDLLSKLSAGTANVAIQLRYESVDQDNLAKDANASTLRARLGYTTGRWNGIDAQLEYENVTALGSEDFDSTDNGRTIYPIVADPRTSEVNQAWIRWSGLPRTSIKYGRQRLVFDNQRFIGNVGWRQNEQTYDAALLTTTWIPHVALDYAYIGNVNAFRFFDFDPGAGVSNDDDIDLKGHYVHAAITLIERRLVVTPYALLLDFDRIPAPAVARQDTRTLGVRASGTLPVQGEWAMTYALEYADQDDYRDAPAGVSVRYVLVEPGVTHGRFKASVGYERLSGDGSYSFQTPLATLHAFQGWADQFLVTPPDGIDDRYVSVTGGVSRFGFTAVHHDFRADHGGKDYGTEEDVLLTWMLRDGLTIGTKFAGYDAKEFPVSATTASPFDTTKWWTWVEYRF